ncbi:MAG: glutathione peroxidase [Deltaproteobacteria bacterium]|nr:glutathione peroxidase [Deltaproteobacteria bacterium]
MAASFYDFSAQSLDGKDVSMAEFKGKVVLVVNVASKCGFTPQYTGLEELYKKYKERGLVILGFPCNQFGNQEPGSSAEIKQFCSLNYPVSFPIFSKVEVNGDQAHPLYNYLKREQTGLLGTEAVKWNFTKFLVDRSGKVVDRYAPQTTPESLGPDIEKLLAQ